MVRKRKKARKAKRKKAKKKVKRHSLRRKGGRFRSKKVARDRKSPTGYRFRKSSRSKK